MAKDAELLLFYQSGAGSFEKGTWGESILRNITVGDKESTWMKYTILPNLHGQLYTIGTTYQSQEEQGEFIYYFPSSKPLSDGGRFFEIRVQDDKYLLSPSSGGPPLSINETNVVTQTELKFGDNFSFGDNKSLFHFRERKLISQGFIANSQNETTGKSGVGKSKIVPEDFLPGQNGLILSNIFAYLPGKELKSSRHVCKLWSDEAFKILKKRTTLYLNFSQGYHHPNQTMVLFRYLTDMQHRPMTNFDMSLPSFGTFTKKSEDDTSTGKALSKLLDDINYFIQQPSTHSMKKLTLGGLVYFKFDYKLRQKIMLALHGNLQKLKLTGYWNLRDLSGEDYPKHGYFPKLQIFSLSLIDPFLGQFETEHVSWTWLHDIVLAVRSVTTIKFDCALFLCLKFLEKLCTVSTLFPNLNEISLNYINPQLLRCLTRIQPLKKLVLHHLNDMFNGDFVLLDECLKKHSNSLEYLLLIICPRPKSERKDPVWIRFPNFPHLKRLTIGWYSEYDAFTRTTRGDFATPVGKNINIVFPGDRKLKYKLHLPLLESLELMPAPFQGSEVNWAEIKQFWKDHETLYETFFPSIASNFEGEPGVCESIRELWIATYLPPGREGVKAKISTMFPRAQTYLWFTMESSKEPQSSDDKETTDNKVQVL